MATDELVFTQFTILNEKHPDGHMCPEGGLQTKPTARPDHLWPEIWSSMSVGRLRVLRLTHVMTSMTTPITKGCLSDLSIILPTWSVAQVGPGQYPRYTSAVKDGRPWVAQATDKAAKHHRNTTHTKTFTSNP